LASSFADAVQPTRKRQSSPIDNNLHSRRWPFCWRSSPLEPLPWNSTGNLCCPVRFPLAELRAGFMRGRSLTGPCVTRSLIGLLPIRLLSSFCNRSTAWRKCIRRHFCSFLFSLISWNSNSQNPVITMAATTAIITAETTLGDSEAKRTDSGMNVIVINLIRRIKK